MNLQKDFIEASNQYIKLYGLSEESFQKISLELYDDINHFSKLFSNIQDFLNSYFIIENKRFKAELYDYKISEESRMSDLIFEAIKLKLSLIDKEFLEQVIKYLALSPMSNGVSLDSLYRTSDTIWLWLGDNEIDFSYYTKRISLSMVVSSTLLYYIKIDNLDNVDSFLQTQLYAFSKIAKIKNKFCKYFSN